MDCLSRDPDLRMVVDNRLNAQKLNDEAKKRGLKMNVPVDLDPGMGRSLRTRRCPGTGGFSLRSYGESL
jgi:D-serine deaminase-like pyridoxal phosphate-dependent protein